MISLSQKYTFVLFVLSILPFCLKAEENYSTASSSIGLGEVLAVSSNRVSDFVLVQGGFENGFRQGMIFRVIRDNQFVAQIVLSDLRIRNSIALILKLPDTNRIKPRDLVLVETLKI